MKKIIASLLCVVMLLTTMSFAVVADSIEIKNDRSINVYVDKTEVYAKDGEDIVTVTVKIEGRSDLANAQYSLSYDPNLFTLIEAAKDSDGDGVITEMFYKTKGTYTNGETLETYTFKAIPQDVEKTGQFFMQEAFTYTHIESIEHEKFQVASEGKEVTIKLIEYEVGKYLDGNLIDETAGEVTGDSFPYDDNEHTFHIETIPGATIEYTVNGTPVNEVKFKGEGTYVITYVVDNAIGHGPVTGTFTIVIEKPEFVVEVVEDYVFADDIGKNLVLVYTKTDNVGFNYDGNVMLDVKTSGYTYEGTSYDFVYGFVVDPIDGGVLADYEALIEHWYDDAYTITSVGTYDEDLNYDGVLDMQDITVEYGVANGFEGYFNQVKYQRNLLKADVVPNKLVRGEDTGAVVDAVKEAMKNN